KREPALNPNEYKKFMLREKQIINHNTRLFRFNLHHPEDVVGLPIGQHMSVKATVDGKEIYRPYTPVSSDDEKGYFDLIIKVYEKGQMSQYIDHLNPGDFLQVRGPKGQFDYKPNMVKEMGMIAGGTGITPMLQVARAIIKNPKEKTIINLIFANVNEDDILLRTELDDMAKKYSNFKVYYVLNNPPAGWTGGVGFVSADMIKQHFSPPSSDIKVMMCGPPMMNKAMQGHLETLGYTPEQWFIF
nr:Chain A, NADH-cytochrome b5 reductase [Physarum polycephalum]2EIX_B Chain B, NADH-cytochrome b5 reductase [Physarum polycephalum]